MTEVPEKYGDTAGQFAEGGLDLAREPSVVLAEAHKAAAALRDVIEKKTKKVFFNNEQYLEFEDWQTVGKFYGVTAKVLSTQYVEFGNVKGFEARAVALVYDKRTGETSERSAADAMCLNDEPNWSTRPKYEWHYVKKSGGLSSSDPGSEEIVWENVEGKNRPKKIKVKVSEEQVPLFQLRSMSQTRACDKVLRNVLAWVVVLAGYRPTPAEELDFDRGRTQESETQREVKDVGPVCPKCGKDKPVIKDQYAGSPTALFCFPKKAGCGHKWDTATNGKPQAENGQPKPEEKGLYELTSAHRLLDQLVRDYCNNDMIRMADMVETLTAWEDARQNKHPGRREISSITESVAEQAIEKFQEQFGKVARAKKA